MIDTDNIYFITYYPSDETTVIYNRVRDLVDEFYCDGYTLVNGYAHPFSQPDNQIRNESQLKEMVRDCLPKVQGNSKSLYFWRYPFEFNLSFQMEAEYGIEVLISVTLDTLLGPQKKLGKKNSRELLKVVQIYTKHFPPVFGCGLTSEEPPLPEDALALKVNTLYPINYYGPLYVNQIGKEKLFSTPAWRVEEIGEGILLVPSIRELYDLDTEKMQMVAEHLGLSSLAEGYE